MEQPIEQFLVVVQQGVQFVRECKHHMVIRRINDLRPALVNPDFLIDCLAVGAVPVTAGIVVDFRMPAFCADADVIPKAAGFASDDGICRFFLDLRLEGAAFAESIIRILEYFLYFKA